MSDLQSALDDAVSQKIPFVIAPGFHVLTEPLHLRGLFNQDISAYGAVLQADTNMAALVDMADSSRCTWRGGRLKVSPGVTVDNALYVYRDTGQCTHNHFQDMMIQGPYTTAIRIGRSGNTGQCDHIYFDNIECNGAGLAGQTGIYVGTGIYSNCLNHTFRNVMLSGHDTHARVSATNTYWHNIFTDRATVTDWLVAATNFNAENIRSESGYRFLVTGGPSSAGTTIHFKNVMYHCDRMAADAEFIRAYTAGLLRLTNFDMRSTTLPCKIKASPSSPMLLLIDGMVNRAPLTGLLSVSSKVQAIVHNYVETASNSSVLSATP